MKDNDEELLELKRKRQARVKSLQHKKLDDISVSFEDDIDAELEKIRRDSYIKKQVIDNPNIDVTKIEVPEPPSRVTDVPNYMTPSEFASAGYGASKPAPSRTREQPTFNRVREPSTPSPQPQYREPQPTPQQRTGVPPARTGAPLLGPEQPQPQSRNRGPLLGPEAPQPQPRSRGPLLGPEQPQPQPRSRGPLVSPEQPQQPARNSAPLLGPEQQQGKLNSNLSSTPTPAPITRIDNASAEMESSKSYTDKEDTPKQKDSIFKPTVKDGEIQIGTFKLSNVIQMVVFLLTLVTGAITTWINFNNTLQSNTSRIDALEVAVGEITKTNKDILSAIIMDYEKRISSLEKDVNVLNSVKGVDKQQILSDIKSLKTEIDYIKASHGASVSDITQLIRHLDRLESRVNKITK